MMVDVVSNLFLFGLMMLVSSLFVLLMLAMLRLNPTWYYYFTRFRRDRYIPINKLMLYFYRYIAVIFLSASAIMIGLAAYLDARNFLVSLVGSFLVVIGLQVLLWLVGIRFDLFGSKASYVKVDARPNYKYLPLELQKEMRQYLFELLISYERTDFSDTEKISDFVNQEIVPIVGLNTLPTEIQGSVERLAISNERFRLIVKGEELERTAHLLDLTDALAEFITQSRIFVSRNP